MNVLLIVFISVGLLVYWISRTWLLLNSSEVEIEEQLEMDLWWFQRFLDFLQSMLTPSFSS
jgi:hypothetical protein